MSVISKKTGFKHQYDPDYKPNKGSDNQDESVTQPDMTLSLRQIMMNHTRGIGLGVNINQGIYSETDVHYFDDFTDMVEHAEYLQEQTDIINREIEAENKKRKEAIEPPEKEKEEQESKAKEKVEQKSS